MGATSTNTNTYIVQYCGCSLLRMPPHRSTFIYVLYVQYAMFFPLLARAHSFQLGKVDLCIPPTNAAVCAGRCLLMTSLIASTCETKLPLQQLQEPFPSPGSSQNHHGIEVKQENQSIRPHLMCKPKFQLSRNFAQ